MGTYKLKIIDTIEFFILALDKNIYTPADVVEELYNNKKILISETEYDNIVENNVKNNIENTNQRISLEKKSNNIIYLVEELYKTINVEVDIKETPYSITEDQFDFITSICGKIIEIDTINDSKGYNIYEHFRSVCDQRHCPYQVESNTVNDLNKSKVYERLLIDIPKILNFKLLKSFWIKNTNIIKHIKYDTEKTFNNELNSEIQPFGQENLFSNIELDNNNCFDNSNKQIETFLEKNDYTYIIYNTLYNTCIVKNFKPDIIGELTKNFSEFVIIDRFTNISDNILNLINNIFDIQIFESIDQIKEKLNSFKILYDINSKKNIIDKENEKNIVLKSLNIEYKIDPTVDIRIKARTLYQLIECYNPQYKGDLVFRKRVSSYLIELGLRKKRNAEGIVYIGLNPIKLEKIKVTPLEEIMKKRNIELKELCPNLIVPNT
jgi:hypothetical protein